MGKNNKQQNSPLVYSTDPNYKPLVEEVVAETLAPDQQTLRVILETKHRAGKTVTIVYGFQGKEEDMNESTKIKFQSVIMINHILCM